MSELVDALRWAWHHIFMLLLVLLATLLIYHVLFVGDNSAVNTMCRSVEVPLARYYYRYTETLSTRSTEAIASDLGYTVFWSETNLNSSGATGGEVDSASGVAQYSTGWF